ncbi:MAG TPA: LEA type 2 family protein [Crocinitomicaceae bacterium]|nr:LEA type 2 family protein [Crocinitomicaceae bacterium]
MKKIISFFIISLTLSACHFEDIKYLGADNISNITKSGKGDYTVSVDFKIDNPNTYHIKVKPSDINVFLNNSKIGVVRLDEKVKLVKKTKGVYTTKLNLKLEKLNFFDIAKNALFGKTSIQFQGKVKAGTGIFFKKFDVNETRKLDKNQLKQLLSKFGLDL